MSMVDELTIRLKSHGFGLLKMEPFEMFQQIKGKSTRICDIKSTLWSVWLWPGPKRCNIKKIFHSQYFECQLALSLLCIPETNPICLPIDRFNNIPPIQKLYWQNGTLRLFSSCRDKHLFEFKGIQFSSS